MDHLDASEFIMINQNLAVQEEMTQREIVNIVKKQLEDEENDETDEPEPEKIITSINAIKGLEDALKYVQQKNLEIDFQVIRSIKKLKSEISYRNSQESVQKRIEDYISMIE